jgi:hypothetical protein
MAAVSKKNDNNQQKNQFLVFAVEILLIVFILLWLPPLVTGLK